MGPLQTTRLALRALKRNTLRSFLTALGIIIGVAAVIAMVAIGEGARAQVEETFAAMGTNLLIVMPGSSSAGGLRGGFGTQPTLTWDDLRALQTEVPAVEAAAPTLRLQAQVQSDEQNWGTSVQGTTPTYFDVRRWRPRLGPPMTEADLEAGAKVMWLGLTVAEKLFGPDADPLGHLVRVKGVPFTVVGVLEKKGQSPMGQDYDDTVFVPSSTFKTRLNPGLGNFLSGVIFVQVRAGESTQRAQRQVTALLRDRHRLGEGQEDDFSIRNLAEVASAQQQGADTLSALLASIAAVSLLVGGIGIMNIMLVSVTERTREIGIRMAVGATPAQILAQFLVEALALAIVGGLLGVGVGLLAAQQLSASFGWPLLVRPDVVALATGFSGLVGVGFGLYPAVKASRMDPITALRFE
ncbi:MAG: ABC transporter permease [Myxococcaceae bacterium]|jgi:putative ABC transport system permease protein|nr:ABC transporter permease [Myxococcaceae bacterium]MCA3013188.1 ABC transporter permease [Myxococcaceae bacterium]